VSTVTTAFARATAVEPAGPGAWTAALDGAWSAPSGLNGGYLAAVVLRAMLAELDDPARHARSLTCHYLRRSLPGEARLEVTVERAGRTLSTLTVRMSQSGRLCLAALGAFATELAGADEWTEEPPAVPAPEELVEPDPLPGVPMLAQFVVHPALGGPPFGGAPEAVTGGWLRFAEPQPLDAPALAMYADGWLPSAWTRLTRPAGAPTVDLTVHFRAPATALAVFDDPVLAVFRSRTASEGFFEEDGELWSRDGVLLAHSRQLALLLDEESP
jgi:acyl-CoA thioesterase